MAQLLDWLALAGARYSSGAPVSSGSAWFYEVGGGTTVATVYADVDGTVIAPVPVALDAGGRATVYVTSPVRVVIQDSMGADVSDADQANVHRAEAVQVDNAGWTSGYLDGVLTDLYTSTGATDGMYKESSGATARTIKAKFSELSVSVKDFGAKGDGLSIDTTAVQAAINRVAFLGGGVVFFPPGTYLIDQGLTLSSKNGVSLKGTGALSSVLKNTSAINTLFTFASCSYFRIDDLYLTASTTSTGDVFTFSGTTGNFIMSGVRADNHLVMVRGSGTGDLWTITGCSLNPYNGDAGARGIYITGAQTSDISIYGSVIGGGSGYTMEFLLGTQNVYVTNCWIDPTAIRFNLSGGQHFKFIGNRMTAVPPFSFAAGAPRDFYQYGNGADGYTTTIATGVTFVPDWSYGNDIRINVTSGGAGTVTVSAPTPVPNANQRGIRLITRHVNALGGAAAVTWAMNASFVLDGGTAIPTTDGKTIIVEWLYDNDSTKWREVGRTNTTT